MASSLYYASSAGEGGAVSSHRSHGQLWTPLGSCWRMPGYHRQSQQGESSLQGKVDDVEPEEVVFALCKDDDEAELGNLSGANEADGEADHPAVIGRVAFQFDDEHHQEQQPGDCGQYVFCAPQKSALVSFNPLVHSLSPLKGASMGRSQGRTDRQTAFLVHASVMTTQIALSGLMPGNAVNPAECGIWNYFLAFLVTYAELYWELRNWLLLCGKLRRRLYNIIDIIAIICCNDLKETHASIQRVQFFH